MTVDRHFVIAVVGIAAKLIGRKEGWPAMACIYASVAVAAVIILSVREMSVGYGP